MVKRKTFNFTVKSPKPKAQEKNFVRQWVIIQIWTRKVKYLFEIKNGERLHVYSKIRLNREFKDLKENVFSHTLSFFFDFTLFMWTWRSDWFRVSPTFPVQVLNEMYPTVLGASNKRKISTGNAIFKKLQYFFDWNALLNKNNLIFYLHHFFRIFFLVSDAESFGDSESAFRYPV